MALYRLFILDEQENLVTGVDFLSMNDDEALDWSAYVLQPARRGELWCGVRCVGRINHARAALGVFPTTRRNAARPPAGRSGPANCGVSPLRAGGCRTA